jgi:hypothetical protein
MKTRIPLQYKAGTSKTPQLTELSAPAFSDTSGVHFPDGRLRTVAQWSNVTPAGDLQFIGVCRSVVGAYTTKYHYFFGTHKRLYVLINSVLYNITPLQTTSTAIANSIDTTNTLSTIVIDAVAHGLVVGDRVKISGAANVGGITAATYINKEHIITARTTDTFTVDCGFAATSTVANGGGASTVYFKQIDAGNENQAIGYGYGGGLYGVGLYGVGKTFTNTLTYPRIWSIDTFGNDVIVCAGDYKAGDGQKIWIWQNDTNVAPTLLTNAPTDANWVYVSNGSIVALRDNAVDVSLKGDGTVWPTTTGTFRDEVERSNRLIRGITARGADLHFSEDEVLRFSFVGDPYYREYEMLLQTDGLIAPQAVTSVQEVLFFMGKHGFYSFDGNAVQKLVNEQNEDWIFENLNQGAKWTCFARPDPENSQVWFFFPTGSAANPTDYVIYNYRNGSWTLGKRDLTAYQQPAVVGGREYSAKEGVIYLDNLTTGTEAITPYAEMTYSPASNEMPRFRIERFIADASQVGDITVTFKAKEYPQRVEEYSDVHTVTSTTEFILPRVAGKVAKVRFSQTGAGNRFTIGAPIMEINTQGRN